MSLVRFVAWRFMLKGTEKGTFSGMTLFAWLAIGVGVGAMSSLLSVMYGFESALKDRILKAFPHVMVKAAEVGALIDYDEKWTEQIKKIKGVRRVFPYVETEMIVQGDSRALGSVVWGLPKAEWERLANDENSTLTSKSKKPSNKNLPKIVLGSELAYRVDASNGGELQLLSPLGRTGPMGLIPQSEVVEVSGIYSSGHYDFDQQYAFLELGDAQDLLKKGNRITGWQVWGDDVEDADALEIAIAKILPTEWEAQSWTKFNSALFQSLRLEQYAMFSILSFAIIIAVMNIVITLMMHVSHKKKNIGILRAIGASTAQVRRIFIWQGAFLGGVGLCIGAALTVLILVYIKYFSSYQLPDIYYDRSIPIEIRPLSMVLIYVVATVMIYIATLYPSWRAAKLDPIEAIRE